MKKTKKGYKKWVLIDAKHCQRKKRKIKKEYGRYQYQIISKEKTINKLFSEKL